MKIVGNVETIQMVLLDEVLANHVSVKLNHILISQVRIVKVIIIYKIYNNINIECHDYCKECTAYTISNISTSEGCNCLTDHDAIYTDSSLAVPQCTCNLSKAYYQFENPPLKITQCLSNLYIYIYIY